MFKKNFTIVLPDEPYKISVDNNNTVNCKYTGPRFLAICVHTPSGNITYVARYGPTLADLDMQNLTDQDPDTEFYVLDANEHPFEAAYLQGEYTHDPIPAYEETLPNNLGTWNYTYSENGAIAQMYYFDTLKYINGQFTGPTRREHAISRDSFFAGNNNIIAALEADLSNPEKLINLDDDEKAQLDAHLAWLKSLPTIYADVDHWKIPFPTDLPLIE